MLKRGGRGRTVRGERHFHHQKSAELAMLENLRGEIGEPERGKEFGVKGGSMVLTMNALMVAAVP